MKVIRRNTMAFRRSVSRLAGSVIGVGLAAFITGNEKPVDVRRIDASIVTDRSISAFVVSAMIEVAALTTKGGSRRSVSRMGTGMTAIRGRSVRTRGSGLTGF